MVEAAWGWVDEGDSGSAISRRPGAYDRTGSDRKRYQFTNGWVRQAHLQQKRYQCTKYGQMAFLALASSSCSQGMYVESVGVTGSSPWEG